MGAYFIWYFHYMPVGNDAAPELLPNPNSVKPFITVFAICVHEAFVRHGLSK